jgi:hypothetical protein
MSYFLRSLLAVVTIFIVSQSSAQAEVFYWQDPETKVSATYPDRWQRLHNQKTDDVLTVIAPGKDEQAICRLRVREDRRFVIYPNRYADEIVRQNYAKSFWEAYVREYDQSILHSVTINGGLGRGHGTYAEASYVTNVGPKMAKRAMMFVSLYHDKAYIAECSAEIHSYHKWHDAFLSFVKSVDFGKSVNELPSGHYRNFTHDDKVRINNARLVDEYIY